MLGMPGIGGNHRVRSCRLEPVLSVLRVIVRVNDVVRRTWMFSVLPEDLLRIFCRAEVGWNVTITLTQSE